jgi:nucleoid-associated protein EbfC
MKSAAWYNTLSVKDQGGTCKMLGSVKQIQQMQQRLLKVQEELKNETVEATAGGGVVKVVITGDQTVKAITIDPEAVDPSDVSLLEDLMVAAVNEAITKSQELATKRMGAITGNLRIPGM